VQVADASDSAIYDTHAWTAAAVSDTYIGPLWLVVGRRFARQLE
jgi:hypothetical protein